MHGNASVDSDKEFIAPVRCIEVRVVGAEGECAGASTQSRFDPLAARLAEIPEVAESRLIGRDEEDVVFAVGPEPAEVPLQACRLAANAQLVGPRDHLLERRVGGPPVGPRGPGGRDAAPPLARRRGAAPIARLPGGGGAGCEGGPAAPPGG